MSFPAFPAQLCVPDMHTLARLLCPLVYSWGRAMAESDRRLEGQEEGRGQSTFLPFPLCLEYRPDRGLLGFTALVPTGQVTPNPTVLVSSGWRQDLSSANTLTSLPLSLQPKDERPFLRSLTSGLPHWSLSVLSSV